MFEKWKEKKIQKKEQEKTILENRWKKRALQYNNMVNDQEKKMMEQICAFMNAPCIGSKCIHFKPGNVWIDDDFGPMATFPKCKLWNNKS